MVLSKDLKIAICFGLIIGALFSLCTCFASEPETVTLDTYISNAGLSFNNGGSIVSSGGRVYYLEIEPGYMYTITSSLDNQRIAFGNSAEIGANIYDMSLIGENTFTFSASEYKYIYFFVGTSSSGFVGSVTRVQLNGLPDVVDNLAYSLSYNDLGNVFALTVPILAISVLVGLGIYLVRRIINKIKKKKGGI